MSGYPDVPAHPSFPTLEQDVLASWDTDDTFRASVDRRPAGENGADEYVFYDGPPFANGLPHYGHLLTGYVKDVVPRYRTMSRRRVRCPSRGGPRRRASGSRGPGRHRPGPGSRR